MATLSPSSPPPFPTLITTTKLHHSSLSSPKLSPFPSHNHHRFRFRFRFSRRAKLNNYGGEEARKIVDEAFWFGDGDDDLAEDDESDGDGEEGGEEEMEESSVELLLRFLQSVVKKISRRAKKASRSVLPPAISPQLVSFAVDGIMLLASLSIVKALLEVVCTLGGTVFVAILFLRLVWSALSYFQASGSNFNQGGNSYGPTQPVS